jgi:flavin reductase (DIM6/NTAB) family NADH-FMN oxidoreductase RutF
LLLTVPISETEFRNALSRFASGVSVVTTSDNQGRFYGITVSAFCSVSLEPPLVLICIEKSTASHFAIRESQAFIVNVLQHSQIAISQRFAEPVPDKFENVAYRPGISGIPCLEGSLANIECWISEIYEAGDHSVIVGSVESASVAGGDPLLYFRGRYGSLASDAVLADIN